MTLPSTDTCKRIRKVHALLGSSVPSERASAHEKLAELLAKHGLTWNDLPAILAVTEHLADITFTDVSDSTSTRTATSPEPPEPPAVNVLDLVLALIERHVAITPEERMAVALWVLHTWIFDQYSITPRLAVLSPVRECGKTTLVALIKLLVAEPYINDDITSAFIYQQITRSPRTTLLIDEADNLGLLSNRVLRAIFNSGHRRGGSIGRSVGGVPTQFSTFAPLVIAAIGTLPLPLLGRAAAVINMQRFAPGAIQIQRLDDADPSFAVARDEIRKWASMCSLAQDPDMPPSLRNRAADNWRVLLAIADDLGHGETARSAAAKLCAYRPDEDPSVVLLANIQNMLLSGGLDRIASSALVEALLGLDDGLWNEWRGPHDRLPHKLTQGELAQMLGRFHIRPRTIWPPYRQPGDRSSRGYYRHQFEDAWRAYCPAATPTQPGRVKYLRKA